MTALDSLRARVAAGVAERLVPVLFERAKRVHAKREWRDCECDWCRLKRRATVQCADAPYWLAGDRRAAWRAEERWLASGKLAAAYDACASLPTEEQP